MTEGDVILTPIPQADGQFKNRPAVVLRQMPPFGDLLVCGISTQLRQAIANFDAIISSSDTDFAGSGLQATSLIRLGFLSVLPRNQIIGSIGSISTMRRQRLLQNLADYLMK